jgi:dienelactone hydrolase
MSVIPKGFIAAACIAHGALAAEIPIEVLKPDGDGPFPAVVLLHDCSGLGPRSSGAPRRWAKELLAQGFVVAIPDSFGTRGHPDGVCTDPSPSRQEVAPLRRVPDAYAALDHLQALPFVDGAHVGVMGGSHGGATTLATIAEQARDPAELVQRKRHGFAAAIAFYPACDIGNPRFTREFRSAVPVLILAGELDDWTPAAPCRKLAEAALASGSRVELKVYPGAHHAFDSDAPVRYRAARVNAHAASGRGATTGGNPEAWRDSIDQVRNFFARELRAR